MSPGTWSARLLSAWGDGDRIAVETPEERWTADELFARAGAVAQQLDAWGFPPGGAVPLVADASPTALALVLGATLTGRPPAPLAHRHPPAELALAVRALGAPAVVGTEEHRDSAGRIAAASGVALRVLDATAAGPPLAPVTAGPDDVVSIVHTSGTTGVPKAVRARQAAFVARLDVYEDLMPIGPGDRFCTMSPLHHTAGVSMLLTALGRGATVLPQARFSVTAWPGLGELGVTHALLVPTMIDQLLAEGTLAAARPRVLQYGAAPIDVRTLRAALDALPGVELLQVYGQTEISPVTALTHADHLRGLEEPGRLATVGRAAPGVELRLEDVGDAGIGDLTVRAAHLWAPDADGWRRTGDLATIDDEGYVTLHGRTHDRIVRGGENIYPLEVERAIGSHPAVREVAVVGVPDRRYGELVKAVVVPTDAAAPPTLDELRAHVRDRLAPFKAPTLLDLVDALPRDPNGKVQRRRLVGDPR